MEILRTGKAPPLIRRKAAEGGLPVSLEEKIEILVTLCDDADEAKRDMAVATLEKWDSPELKQVISTPPRLQPQYSISLSAIWSPPGRNWRKCKPATRHFRKTCGN